MFIIMLLIRACAFSRTNAQTFISQEIFNWRFADRSVPGKIWLY